MLIDILQHVHHRPSNYDLQRLILRIICIPRIKSHPSLLRPLLESSRHHMQVDDFTAIYFYQLIQIDICHIVRKLLDRILPEPAIQYRMCHDVFKIHYLQLCVDAVVAVEVDFGFMDYFV